METTQARQQRIGNIVNSTLLVRGPERNGWFGASVSYLHALEKTGKVATRELLKEQLEAGLPALQAAVEHLRNPQGVKTRAIAAWRPTAVQEVAPLPRAVLRVTQPQAKVVIGVPIPVGPDAAALSALASELQCVVVMDPASGRAFFTHPALVREADEPESTSKQYLLKQLGEFPLGPIQAGLVRKGIEPDTCTFCHLPPPPVEVEIINRSCKVSRLAVDDIQKRLAAAIQPYSKDWLATKPTRTFTLETPEGGGFVLRETSSQRIAPLQVVGRPQGLIEIAGEPFPALKAALLRHGYDLEAVGADFGDNEIVGEQSTSGPGTSDDDDDPEHTPYMGDDGYAPSWV